MRASIAVDDPVAEQTVELERPSTISGRVTNQNGTSAAGVMVWTEGTHSGADLSENEREVEYADGEPLCRIELTADSEDNNSPIFPVAPLVSVCVTGPNGRFLFRDVLVGVSTDMRYQPDDRGTLFLVHRTVPEAGAGAVTRVGKQSGLKGRAGAERSSLDARRATAFREPGDVAADLDELRRGAALLDRRALVLVADPESDAGRDLFAALYDEPATGRAADAGLLTRCLAANRPSRTGDLANLLGDDFDPAAATLTVLTPDGTVVARYTHRSGERYALVAFLKANTP